MHTDHAGTAPAHPNRRALLTAAALAAVAGLAAALATAGLDLPLASHFWS